jgi:predicted amidophosphoribosyltransferase
MLQLKEIRGIISASPVSARLLRLCSDLISEESVLCLRCLANMPETNFHLHPNNPAEKNSGQAPASRAPRQQYYFTKESLMQHLMHQLKYKGKQRIGKAIVAG